jgi:hypothetical protein
MDAANLAAEAVNAYLATDTQDAAINNDGTEVPGTSTSVLKEIFRKAPERFIIATIPQHHYTETPKHGDSGMDF